MILKIISILFLFVLSRRHKDKTSHYLKIQEMVMENGQIHLTGRSINRRKRGEKMLIIRHFFHLRSAECNPGYYGLHCEVTCPIGTFGEKCGGVCFLHMSENVNYQTFFPFNFCRMQSWILRFTL